MMCLLLMFIRLMCFLLILLACSCSSGLCPVACKRDVVSGVCCVALLVGTKRVKCIANTKRTYFKRRHTRRQNILNERTKILWFFIYGVVVICLQ